MRNLWNAAAVLIVAAAFATHAAQAQVEKPNLTIAVGGKSFLQYAPLVLADRLGYFKNEGLNVQIVDVQGGSKALQAMMGGSADLTAGAYDHTIQLQAKGQSIVGTVLFSRFPGISIGIRTELAAGFKGPASLKGMKIGVTSPGSQTHFAVSYIMTRAGLKPDDASFIGVGAGASAVAAIEHGEIDAISNADPAMTELETSGKVKIIADSRTSAGNEAAFGGPYPSGTVYAKRAFLEANPKTVQAMVNAFVRTLKWIEKASPEQIADAMPPEFSVGNRALYLASIRNSREAWSPDGRFSQQGADTALHILTNFDPSIAAASVDLSATFTNVFVDAALRNVQ